MKTIVTYFLFLIACATPLFSAAQKHDTLAAVHVLSKKQLDIAAAPMPVQVMNSDEISKRNSASVADAVKYFAGVNVKDYGGIGGLKTVSVRSLGANNTGVSYNGLILGDAQGGQVDLGKFSLDNVQEIALYNAGPAEILSPARAYATASLLSLNTITGNIKDLRDGLSANITAGSFGYFFPSLRYSSFVSKRFYAALSGYYRTAKGDYPFVSYENNNLQEKRNNSGVKAGSAEYDAAYFINDSNRVSLKAYYYNSKRGLPGAVILYNSFSNQTLDDENLFLQSSWQVKLSRKSRMLLSAKYSNDKSLYSDPAYPNSYGKLENDFHQREWYASASYKYNISKTLAAAFSSDAFNSRLRRTDFLAENFAAPRRNTFLENIALQFKKSNIEANGNLLYTVINEDVAAGSKGRDLHEFSPAIAAAVAPLKMLPLRLRAFYKRIFRAPTFNDLYYTNIGNVNLRPEYSNQYNTGITFEKQKIFFLDKLIFTGDAYYNKVKDKILAVPRQNLFQWSIQNVGNVDIKGIDAAIHVTTKNFSGLSFTADVSYSFQQALDHSNKTSLLYGTQIPYTPKHSGSLSFSACYRNFSFTDNVLFSSYRYRAGDPIPENMVQAWSTNDISLNCNIGAAKNNSYKIIAEANNIFNTQYQIIKYYPMPRFNYRIGITATFNNQKHTNEKELH